MKRTQPAPERPQAAKDFMATLEKDDFWGEPQGDKWEADLRIAVLNTDGFPALSSDPKNGQLF